MAGKTTAGRSTSVDSVPWTGAYQKYMAVFDKPVSKPFALNELNGEIRRENDQLSKDLKYLEGYYDKIAVFLLVAHSVKQDPHNMEVRQSLAKDEDELCSNDMLLAYLHAAIGALRACASIAKKADEYISSLSSSSSTLSSQEIGGLKALLNEVKSISKNVKEDFVAEVQTSPGGALGTGIKAWDGYVSKRHQSLRAAGGVDHLE